MKRLESLYFAKGRDVPNSILPALLFRAVLAPTEAAKARKFRDHFRRNGWTGLWTDTIYDYTHFHSNAHEVLGIAEGKVRIQLGGDAGRIFHLKAGDMLIMPAGVGHRRVGPDDGLKVIGAYPRGQAKYDVKRKGRRAPKVPLPKADPFFGEDGPLIRRWHPERIDRHVAIADQ